MDQDLGHKKMYWNKKNVYFKPVIYNPDGREFLRMMMMQYSTLQKLRLGQIKYTIVLVQ